MRVCHPPHLWLLWIVFSMQETALTHHGILDLIIIEFTVMCATDYCLPIT